MGDITRGDTKDSKQHGVWLTCVQGEVFPLWGCRVSGGWRYGRSHGRAQRAHDWTDGGGDGRCRASGVSGLSQQVLDGVELETGVGEQDGGSSRNPEGVKEEGRGQRRSHLKSSEHFTLEEVQKVTIIIWSICIQSNHYSEVCPDSRATDGLSTPWGGWRNSSVTCNMSAVHLFLRRGAEHNNTHQVCRGEILKHRLLWMLYMWFMRMQVPEHLTSTWGAHLVTQAQPGWDVTSL